MSRFAIATLALILLAVSLASSAHGNDIVMGPLTATGVGVTESVAFYNAMEVLTADVQSISETLPSNYFVLPMMTESSYDGWTCKITYYVTIVEM